MAYDLFASHIRAVAMDSLLRAVVGKLPVAQARDHTASQAIAETIPAAQWHQFRLQQRRLQLAELGDLAGLCLEVCSGLVALKRQATPNNLTVDTQR